MANTKKTVSNVETKTVIAERTLQFDNNESRKAKQSLKDFFGDYTKQLNLQWSGLKNEDTAFKALNVVIAGIAGGENESPATWLIKHFSKYVTENFEPCNKRKDDDGNVYFTKAMQTGVTARGLLKKAALNCIESNRIGNRFNQTIVTPAK